MKPDNGSPWGQVARYTTLAMMLPVSTAAGYGIGYALDHWFGTTYLRIVFLFLGIVSGFVQLIRDLLRDTKP